MAVNPTSPTSPSKRDFSARLSVLYWLRVMVAAVTFGARLTAALTGGLGGIAHCCRVCRNVYPEPFWFCLYDVLNSRVLVNGSEMGASVYGPSYTRNQNGSASTTYSMLRLHSIHPASDSRREVIPAEGDRQDDRNTHGYRCMCTSVNRTLVTGVPWCDDA
jgi:hypothetical protein